MSVTTTSSGLAAPSFVVDWQSVDRDNGHQIDWPNVGEFFRGGGVIVVGAAGAAQNATSVPVLALEVAVPAGAVLWFTGAKFAEVTTLAAVGATALVTTAIPTALVSGDAATLLGSGNKVIPSGQIMSIRTTTPIGKMIPRRDTASGTGPADGLLATSATENATQDALSGYGLVVGGVVYESLLPEATGGPPKVLSSGQKTALALTGKYVYRSYTDTRAA
jgi:hypothetical protein